MKNRNQYPENWEDTIRPFILKRDRYTCTMCPSRHRAIGYYNQNKVFVECDEHMQAWAKRNNLKLVKIHLQVMHLDHDKKNCDENNLASGCPRCHLNHDRAYNNFKRKMKGRQAGTNGGSMHFSQGPSL